MPAICFAMHAAADASALAERYRAVRACSLALIAGLSAEDCAAQAMSDASPQKWHLAHTSWFFETLVISRSADAGYRSPDPRYRHLFNSYYQGIGTPYPRPQRGLLTRPTLPEVLAWRAHVDAAMLRIIDNGAADTALVELGLQHEQQHQELMRTDLLALMALNPLRPALQESVVQPGAALASSAIRTAADAPAWLAVPGGVTRIGHTGEGFCFDNELPAHQVLVAPFEIARSLVTQRDYLAFIDDGGYRNPRWWLAEGWDWLSAARRSASQSPGPQSAALQSSGSHSSGSHSSDPQSFGPQYWRHDDATGWWRYGLDGEHLVRHADGHRPSAESTAEIDAELARPIAHLCYYEADAYARWAGARLPTEQEWEVAARELGDKLDALFGDCWQWTASAYAAYPGFRPLAGDAGEYNGKFMLNQQVLRGSSCYTPPGHARISYRNFFPAYASWQRSGLRLAR